MLHTQRVTALLALALFGVASCEDKPAKPSANTEGGAVASPAQAPAEGRPMLVVFSRDYCTPCQVMKPWVEELAAQTSGVDVVTVNVDRKNSEHIGGFFKISAVPTLIYLQPNGLIARRTEGLAKKSQMTAAFEELGWR